LNHYRHKSREATASAVELDSQYRAVAAEHSRLKREARDEIKLLEDRLKEVEGERDALRGWQRRAENLSIELEDVRRNQEQGAQAKDDSKAEQRANDIVLKEVQREL
jgi:hypothetical protein